MSFHRYPMYRESGVEWLGQIPAHWAVRRLKHACHVFPSNVDKKSLEGEMPVVLCNYTDVYYNDVITAELPFMSATASEAQIEKFALRAGDTIITKDSETADDIAISAYVPHDLPGVVCGYHLSIVRPEDGADGAFVKRLFDSVYARSKFATLANGLTRVGLGQYELDNVELPFPPLDEQRSIAAFLDRETAKIDALISEQQRLMELLQEKRQAVISHAVTKGLNPDAPMKPSGVEWLGEVPAHWDICRIKHVVDAPSGIQMGPFGGMLLNLETEETGYRVFGQENTISGDFARGSRWISAPRFAELANYHIQIGDLLLTRKGSLGNARLVEALPTPGIFDSDTIRVRVDKSRVLQKYLTVLLHEAGYVSEQISMSKRGAILSGLNSETVANIVIALPPVNEQHTMLARLEQTRREIDENLAVCERAVELMSERRMALISAAVTGQIDVRSVINAEAA